FALLVVETETRRSGGVIDASDHNLCVALALAKMKAMFRQTWNLPNSGRDSGIDPVSDATRCEETIKSMPTCDPSTIPISIYNNLRWLVAGGTVPGGSLPRQYRFCGTGEK